MRVNRRRLDVHHTHKKMRKQAVLTSATLTLSWGKAHGLGTAAGFMSEYMICFENLAFAVDGRSLLG